MKKYKNCIFCYQPLSSSENKFHERCCKKFFGKTELPEVPFKLSEVYELAKQNVNQHLTVTGVQNKLSVGIQKTTQKSRLTIVGWDESEASYILKTQSERFPELPEVEDLTMHLASLVGLAIVPHTLIPLQTGDLAYLTRRIDRSKNKKIHMEDMCQLTERLAEDKYKGSYEQIHKTIKRFSSASGFDSVTFFELIVFCFITGNADMHLKNFSLIHNLDDSIRLAPAYDLLATKLVHPTDKEETALTLNGKKKNLRKKDFYTFGERIELTEKQISNAIKGITAKLSKADTLIDQSFLSKQLKEDYKELIQSRIQRLSE